MTGFDWAFIDAEHAPFTPVLLANIINTISTASNSKTIPVVRVPAMEPSFISVALNAGAAGIVRPHTETREDALQLIEACRYPPLGKRSYGPWAWMPGVNDAVPQGKTLFDAHNESIACIAQIESRLGLQNMEDIISLEGIDAIMIGMGDLRLDMGLPLHIGNEPEYVEAIQKLEATMEERVRKGYKLLMVGADSLSLVYGLAVAGRTSRATIVQVQADMAKEGEGNDSDVKDQA
ncbi:SubName: Full=Related to 2,4-dihydroxyhept-2-ene-1,7-dioic acid aldolase {ECO:0000313/EMBL:CCA68824.1} [Serendipita indica DSM 11827]|nr:SubName: Full=Related to 2,4-dihydroxyhept-2-ene-1,7-dioic acid aldolase {ECO:0000313/EMBL:CCA68824.1} [Serendipita indica DSM 11827]